MTNAELEIGQIVKSKQGRDKGKVYIVIEILSGDYVLLADGDTRKINNPKKKKNKHLMVYNSKINDIIEKLKQESLDDFFIKKSLAPFKS